MRKDFLIVLALVAILVCPVFAQTVTETAPSGKAIVNIYIVSNEGTSGTITFQQQNGQTIAGAWSYQTVTELYGYSLVRRGVITLPDDIESRDYVTPGQLYTMFYHVPGVANVTKNRLSGYMDQSKVSFFPAVETNTTASPIISYTIVADAEVEEWFDYADISAQQSLLSSSEDDWIKKIMELAYGSFWAGYNLIVDLVYWTRYFFVDNLGMIVALFLAVPMAFAAKNSKGNPERFLRQYFKTLKGFFEFILFLWRMLLESIGTIRGWFRL